MPHLLPSICGPPSVKDGDSEYIATLRASVLDAYREEYEDLAADWRSVDSKAQALIGAAGIFLSATIVFAGFASHNLTATEKLLVCTALVTIVLAIGFALRAQLITETGGMPSGKTVHNLIDDVLRNGHGEKKKVLLEAVYNGLTTKWGTSNVDVENKVTNKANNVQIAQWLLVATLGIFVMLAVVRVFVSN